MKDKLLEELLKLHCVHCHGQIFGCKGCTKKEEINSILESMTSKEIIEEVVVEEETKEEPVEVIKKPKNTKKK